MRPLSLRRLLPWLFALILLFGQAAAFAHTLTHLHPHDADQANHPSKSASPRRSWDRSRRPACSS